MATAFVLFNGSVRSNLNKDDDDTDDLFKSASHFSLFLLFLLPLLW